MLVRIALLGLSLIASTYAQTTPSPKPAAKVIIAGTGEAPYLQIALDSLTDLFSSNGVSIKQMDLGAKTRAAYVDLLPSTGAISLLYVTVIIQPHQRSSLTIDCFDLSGKKLWQEENKVGMVFNGQIIQKLLKNIEKPVKQRIGGEGIPTK